MKYLFINDNAIYNYHFKLKNLKSVFQHIRLNDLKKLFKCRNNPLFIINWLKINLVKV